MHNVHHCNPEVLNLEPLNSRNSVWIEMPDAPAVDAEGREVHIHHYDLYCRPTGAEQFYRVHPAFGGRIMRNKLQYITEFLYEAWFNAMLPHLLRVEKDTKVPSDGDWDVVWVAVGTNNKKTVSQVTSFRVDLTPAGSVGTPIIRVDPPDESISQVAFAPGQ